MANETIIILGGGIGGLTAARRLRRLLDAKDRIVLVDRDPRPPFAPSLGWVMTGARSPETIRRPLAPLRRRGIEFWQADVHSIDAGTRTVETSTGALRFDRLIVALGAETAPGELPGFAEAAIDLYSLDGRWRRAHRSRRPCARRARAAPQGTCSVWASGSSCSLGASTIPGDSTA